jgi:hypothetical protein
VSFMCHSRGPVPGRSQRHASSTRHPCGARRPLFLFCNADLYTDWFPNDRDPTPDELKNNLGRVQCLSPLFITKWTVYTSAVVLADGSSKAVVTGLTVTCSDSPIIKQVRHPFTPWAAGVCRATQGVGRLNEIKFGLGLSSSQCRCSLANAGTATPGCATGSVTCHFF